MDTLHRITQRTTKFHQGILIPVFLVAMILTGFSPVTAISQNVPTKWSGLVAQSFIKRFPDADSICWRPKTNHFSWQAGYVMFAMEKMWKSTGDAVYFDYVKKYVDQQVDEQGNVFDFKEDALDNFLPGYSILFMYEQTHLEKYRIAAKKVRDGFQNRNVVPGG